MRRPTLSRAVCIGIIVFEIAWIGLPINPSIAIVFFIAGLIFHFANAIVMGLNLFPWAFVAAYPISYEFIIFLNKHY